MENISDSHVILDYGDERSMCLFEKLMSAFIIRIVFLDYSTLYGFSIATTVLLHYFILFMMLVVFLS